MNANFWLAGAYIEVTDREIERTKSRPESSKCFRHRGGRRVDFALPVLPRPTPKLIVTLP